MSTASWAPVDDRIGPLRWWVAVVCGALAPVLVTPLGDLLDPYVRLAAIVGLTVVAVACGLPPTFRRAWQELRGRAPGGATLLTLACVVAVVGAAALFPFAGLDQVGQQVPAIALATAAHLVAARGLSAMLRRVPGAADPGGQASAAPGATRTENRTTTTDTAATVADTTDNAATVAGRADALLRYLPTAVAVLAALTWIGWTLIPGPFHVTEGARTALGVLLVASPAAFLVARLVPTRAARDRGRELGILFGDVDPLRLARVRSIAVNPLGVVTDPLPRLIAVHRVGRLQTTAALEAAASVAVAGNLPIHAALVSAARDRALPLRPARLLESSGLTLVADIKGTAVTVGGRDAFERITQELADSDCRVFVGWGGAARAGFELVPVVRTDTLATWPDVLALPIRPVFVADDPIALRHVGAAMEMKQSDLVPTPAGGWSSVVDDLRHDGPVAVVGDHDLPEHDDVFVMAPGHMSTEDGPIPTSSSTIRLTRGDFASAMRALGLARKTSRVTTQGLVLMAVLHVLGIAAAVAGVLSPVSAAVVGAALPLLAALNALRPRSFARETTPAA